MKVLRLTDKAYEQYKAQVKGNEAITKDQAARKLTRNVALARYIPPRNEKEAGIGNKLYAYGNLLILVRRGKVMQIFNLHSQQNNGWVRDERLYIQLTQELGIID